MFEFSGNRMFKQLQIIVSYALIKTSLCVCIYTYTQKLTWGIYPLQHIQLIYLLVSASIQTYLTQFSCIYTWDLIVQMLNYLFTL